MDKHTLFFALVAAGSACAADVAGPTSGFVWDPAANAVRPVLGIPGASLIGDALDFGIGLSYAAVAPGQDYVLAVTAEGSVRMLRPGASTAAIETVHGAPARIVFSPSGSAALLIGAEAADIFTDMPARPALARTLRLSEIGEVASWAVSDDGSSVLAASSGSVWAAGESAEWRELAKIAAARVAFAPGSREAAVASPAGVAIYSDGAQTASFAAAEGSPAPDSVAFARDGRILLASSEARSVAILNRSGERSSIPCDCAPGGLSGFGDLFRLTELADAPLWLLDPATERMVFVPARVRQTRP